MASTLDNLKEAFAGESQANRKYLAFAKKAEKEGLANVAKLFRATAEAETIHAHGHLEAMDGVGSTAENLKAAIEGECYEYETMYPAMLEQAEKEGHKAKKFFKWALETEKVHAELYKKALEAVETGKDLDVEVYLCPVCGHIELKEPGSCPVCGVPASKYVKIA
jgi:rubrerythrin